MNREEVLNRLQKIFRELFDDETMILTEELKADDLEKWDSIQHISILTEVSEEFGISFSMDELQNISSVRDIVEGVLKK